MARGRSAGYEEQREHILSRATELFARQGYPSTSMNQIAAACGLSKATLYHYLGDKDALLYAVAERHVMRLMQVVHGVAAQEPDPRAWLERMVACILQEYAQARDAHQVLTSEVRFLVGREAAFIRERERAVVRTLVEAIRVHRPDLEASGLETPLALLLFGMMNWMFTWLRPDGPLDHQAMTPVVVQLMLGGLPAVQVPDTLLRGAAPQARASRSFAAGQPASATPESGPNRAD